MGKLYRTKIDGYFTTADGHPYKVIVTTVAGECIDDLALMALGKFLKIASSTNEKDLPAIKRELEPTFYDESKGTVVSFCLIPLYNVGAQLVSSETLDRLGSRR